MQELKQSNLIMGKISRPIPKFCVAITVYRRVETLKESINSVLSQIGDDYYILVCDDFPQRFDETEKYVQSLNNDKIVYYKNSGNLGQTENWNRCFELSMSEYTILLHDDDILYPYYLYNMERILNKFSTADIIYPSRALWHQERGETMPYRQKDEKKYPIYKYTLKKTMFRSSPPTGVLYKTKSFLSTDGFNPKLWPACDWFFQADAVTSLNVLYYEKPLFIYRWSDNDSLKFNTLSMYFELDKELLHKAAEECQYPKLLVEMLIKHRTNARYRTVKEIFPERLNELNLKGIAYPKTKIGEIIAFLSFKVQMLIAYFNVLFEKRI